MTELVYNNVKNVSTGYTSFELNYSNYLYVFFVDEVDTSLTSCSINKLAKELKEVISICQQNLFYAQKLEKQAYDKS